MALDPDIAAQVAHLFDATWAQILTGEVSGAPSAGPMDRDDVDRRDAEVPGTGGPIRVRWYRPAGLAHDELTPALVWAHGGGWRYGGLDMPEADSVAQVVAATLPGTVVSVDYRLAPAHRHPAALEDVAAAYEWVRREGAAHGVDVDRVALGGGSAGAHLAALAALAMAEADRAVPALLLAYPVTDPVDGPWADCHPECPPALWPGRDGIGGMFAAYLGRDLDEVPDDVVPARADLSALPPTLVTTAAVDSLRAQALHFVDLARAAGAPVEHHDVDGVLHGYLNTVGDEPNADAALDRHVDWLRRLIGG